MLRGTRGYVAPEWFKNVPVTAKTGLGSVMLKEDKNVLVDDDETAMADKARLHKWLMIAIWCIQDDPSKRPTMKMVVQMLEGVLEVPQPPSFPSSSFNVSVEY
ncbi:hypothetical protein Q3G72_029817 [Acer saccharum]|nr:hypothetical protein Q3G72_029817 [Acer saccharum]